MKIAILCNDGCEEAVHKEIVRILSDFSKLQGKSFDISLFPFNKLANGAIVYDLEWGEIVRISYYSKTIKKLLHVINIFDYKDLDSLDELTKNISLPLPDYFREKKTFAFRVKKNEEGRKILDSDAFDIERNIGGNLKESLDLDVKLVKPDVSIFGFASNKFIIGFDIVGIDLSKREYKLFANKQDINAAVASCLLEFADYLPGKIILDPFSKAACISIEAALNYLNKSVHFYKKDFLFLNFNLGFDTKSLLEEWDGAVLDPKKLEKTIYAFDSLGSNILAAQKNAKIAGVNKAIIFSRVDVDWIDTKFDDNSVDCIVSFPPVISIHMKKQGNEVKRKYGDLFSQARTILSKSGKIVLFGMKENQFGDIAKNQEFKLVEEKRVFMGKQAFYVSIFEF